MSAQVDGAIFNSANFNGVDLSDTDLRGANLSEPPLWNYVNVKGAKFDKRTKQPFKRKRARKLGMLFVD